MEPTPPSASTGRTAPAGAGSVAATSTTPCSDRSSNVLEQAEIVPGEAALDVGCGPGPLTRAAALAGADVLGVDISTTMIDAATAIAAPGARFEVLDAQTAHLAPVDVVISRFGVMFFEDPVAAFANLATTGGRLCFVLAQRSGQRGSSSRPLPSWR